MAKTNCQILKDNCNEDLTAQQLDYKMNAESMLSSIMPQPKVDAANYLRARRKKSKALLPKAEKAHQEMWDSLMNHMMENGELSYFSIDPNYYLSGLKDKLQSKFGTTASPLTVAQSPQKMIDVNNFVQKLLKKQVELSSNAPSKSLIDRLGQGFMPAAFSDMTNERFGILRRFQEIASSFVESKRSLAFRYLERLGTAANDFDVKFDEILTNQEITEDYTMGGIQVFTSWTGAPVVTFLGTKTINGQKQHMVIYKGKTVLVPLEDIASSQIKASLKRAYRDELTNELMSGDTRYIEYSDKPVTDEEIKQISYILWQMKQKSNLVEEGLMEPESEGRVYTVDKGNYRINMVHIKVPNKDSSKREVYRAHIISHEDLRIPKNKRESVNYFDKKGKPYTKENSNVNILNIADEFGESGYHKASDWKAFGPVIAKKSGLPIKYSTDKHPIDFNIMKNQPNALLMGDVVGGTGNTLWQYIAEIRETLADFADNSIIKTKESNQERIQKAQAFLESSPQIVELLGGKPDSGKIEGEGTVLQQILNHHGIRDSLHVKEEQNDDGTISKSIRTRNSWFNKKNNYMPWMWDRNIVPDMANKALKEIDARYNEIDNPTEEEIEDYNDVKKSLNSVIEISQNEYANSLEGQTKAVLGMQAAMTRHRKAWTDPTLRRKDSKVLTDYIDKTIYNLQQESLYATALETIIDLAKTAQGKDMDMFKAQTAWVVNQLKKALNDPSHYATMPLPFGKEINYDSKKVANFLNKVAKLRGRSTNYDELAAQKFILRNKGITAAILLGASAALVNRSQTMNTIVTKGWAVSNAAWKAMKDKTSYSDQDFAGVDWDLVIEETGTDQMVTAFADAVADENDIKGTDKGFEVWSQLLPGGKYLPAAAGRRLMRMLHNGEKGLKLFLDKGDPDIDKWLKEQESRKKSKYKELKNIVKTTEDKKSAKAVQKMLTSIDEEFGGEKTYLRKQNLQELRQKFIDMLVTPAIDPETGGVNQDRLIAEKQIKAWFGQISQERVQRMVAFKLSYFWNIGKVRGLLTFTEGEATMRRHGAISSLMEAYHSGHLGALGKKIPVQYINPNNGEQSIRYTYECFRTEEAINIARQAVRNEYFGMTKVHMGEAMGGLGEFIWTYKGYPIQQMLADHRIMTSMMGDSNIQTTARITNEMARLTFNAAGIENPLWSKKLKERFGTTGVRADNKLDPNDPDGDPQARAVIRLLMTRGLASVLTAALDASSFFKYASPNLVGVKHIARGAENPLFALGIKLIVNGAIMASGDDEEKARKGVLGISQHILRLFMPLWISLPYQGISGAVRGIKSLSE